MACVAVHPGYRSSCVEMLLERVAAQARQMGLRKLFIDDAQYSLVREAAVSRLSILVTA